MVLVFSSEHSFFVEQISNATYFFSILSDNF